MSNYKTDVEPRLPEVREWAKTMTDSQIALMLGISPKSTFPKWKAQYPDFKAAIEEGRASLVGELKSALVKRAIGYDARELKAVKTYMSWSDDQRKRLQAAGFTDAEIDTVHMVTETVTTRHFPSDVNAINKLLLNYDKDWLNDPKEYKLKEKEVKIKEQKAKADGEWESL
jgi:hypothetical protein